MANNALGKLVVDGAGPPPAFLIRKDYASAGTLAMWNGTTYFFKVEAGTILGQITSSKEWRPCASSLAADTGAGATAVIELVDVTRFYVGDAIYIAGVDSGETVQSIDTATKKITGTGNMTWNTGDEISVGDGSQVAKGILESDTKTFRSDVDEDGAVVHQAQLIYPIRMGVVSTDGLEEQTGVTVEAHLIADLQGFILFEE